MIFFKNIDKQYKQHFAVRSVTLRVLKKERLVFLGGSGSGKTTLLKMVLRLIDPTHGTIFIEGQDYRTMDLITLRRRVGYAIQNTGLFHHMTVFENIAVVLRLLGSSEEAIQTRVGDLLCMVGLDPGMFGQKYPHQLSGGQGQRVGVARAFAHRPEIILMDEPFGGLDPITRNQLQDECIDLQTKLDTTMIFVTHDVHEAVKIGDRIALFKEGELQQIGTPQEVICNPQNPFVEDFFSHQRFQLFLTMKKLSAMPLESGSPQHMQVGINRSLLQLLNDFSQKGVDVISVYKKEQFLGNIHKQTVLRELETLIQEGYG